MIVVYTRINIKTIILVQRNRNIRKVIQPPNAVVHTTNIQRKTTSRNFEKISHIQAPKADLSKSISVVNSEQPMPSKIKYSTIQNKFKDKSK